jgi:peptide/nickel transport system substrate-binding protein
VDTAGNQLPYIDRIQASIVQSGDVAKMRVIAGEADVQLATIMESFSDYPLFAENQANGNYKLKTVDFAEPNAMNIHINMNSQDDAKRPIMGSADFRKALSLALDRDKIIATHFTVGPQKSTPRNFAPYPASAYLDKDMAANYVRFDQAEANRLLDSLGLNRKNAAGKRLLPDGKVFQMVIDVPTYSGEWIDIGLQIAECWQAVGIDVTARSLDPGLWGQRVQGNDFDVSIHTGGGGFPVPSPGEINSYTGYDHADWPVYYMVGNIIYQVTKGKEGFAPDADVQRLWEIGEAAVVEGDQEKLKALMQEAFNIHKKNLYVLGIGTRLPALYIVKNNIHNVPPLSVEWTFGHGGHGRPSQYYFE